MSAAFAITEHPIDSERHVVAVRGELDLYTACDLKEVFADSIAAGRIRIIVDLGETTFLDTSALSVLVAAFKRLRSRGGALAIANANDRIARSFEITGLDQTLPILSTRDAAIKAVEAAGAA